MHKIHLTLSSMNTPLNRRKIIGRLVGGSVGLVISVYFDFMAIGYILTVWGLSALGKEILTWHEIVSDDDVDQAELANVLDQD